MWSAATVLVCALGMLGRSPNTLPPIVFVDTPPRGASPHVEAFVVRGANTIVLVTSSAVFRAAQSAPVRCGNHDAVRKIASIIVHEEWHVRHGPDERGAYQAQLMALLRMGATIETPAFREVSRAFRFVTTVPPPVLATMPHASQPLPGGRRR